MDRESVAFLIRSSGIAESFKITSCSSGLRQNNLALHPIWETNPIIFKKFSLPEENPMLLHIQSRFISFHMIYITSF